MSVKKQRIIDVYSVIQKAMEEFGKLQIHPDFDEEEFKIEIEYLNKILFSLQGKLK